MSDSRPFVAALTGHRPARLAGYDMTHPFYQRLRARLLAHAATLAQEHPRLEIRSGLAQGADTTWAQAGLLMRRTHPGVRVTGWMPCPDQAGRWPASARAEHARLRLAMDAIDVAAQVCTMQAFHTRNARMIAGADLLLAVWDGSDGGGTASTVARARAAGTVVEIIDPASLR